MPGYLGVLNWSRTLSLQSFEEATLTLCRPGLVSESLVDPSKHWALGRAHLGILNPAPQLAPHRNPHVLLAGELKGTLGAAPGAETYASFVADLYLTAGVEGLRQLRGTFSLAIVDADRQVAVLMTDRFGTQPVYWAIDAGSGLMFASEQRGLLRLRRDRLSLNPRAVADYLALGFVTGSRTLATGVEMLDPGSILQWSAETGAKIEPYRSTVSLFERREQTRDAYVTNVVEAFGASVDRATHPPGPLGMSLSGGLDSRAILSALGPAGRTTDTYTLGTAGCADEVIANRLSRLTGTRHQFFELDSRYLTGFLEHLRGMVSLTDGMYLSHGLTEMLALGFFKQSRFRVLLRGHCGELAKTRLAWPLHTDPDVYRLGTAAQLVDHLMRRLAAIGGEIDWLEAFTDSWKAFMEGAASTSLHESVRDLPLSPAELCSYLYLREHFRRFTVPSLELFRNAVEIRLPFVDEDFLAALLSGPPEWRDATELHRTIVARYNKRLLAVRDSNTGAAVDAGPLVTFAADKLNSLLKRLNVRGYRHYHEFDHWMQHMLVQSVETELLSARSLDRGILSREGVHKWLDGARRGHTGYAYLLQVLLILELWQQENLDARRPQ
jgi:asparagine synthase (glutamine-hydrolysing)